MTLTDMMHSGPFRCHEDAVEILEVMRRQETTTYRRTDYLADPKNISILDGSWRQRIVEWMYGVVDHCSLRRDSVAVATYYLDLSVDRGLVECRQEFQLAAMTALQLAIKLYDSTLVKLDSMVKLGRGLFTEEDVVAMEAKMLHALKWQVHPPTPVCFLRQFLRLLPTSVAPLTRYMIAEVTRFIAEISVCLYKFVKYPPSVVAYAGMIIAMERLDEATLPIWQRQQICSTISHVTQLDHLSTEIADCVEQLQSSLEKNISLQDLMNAIDAQCHDGYSKVRSTEYSTALTGGPAHSPREVAGRRL